MALDQNRLVCSNEDIGSTCTAQVTHVRSESPAQQASPSAATLWRARKRRLFWGVGGTILSGLGFIGLALFEQYNTMLSELRSDLKHFNETSGEFVRKDSLQKVRDRMRECIKDLQTSSATRAQLEQDLRASESARTEIASELQRMRERMSSLAG